MQGGFTTCRHYLPHYHTVYTVYISSLHTIGGKEVSCSHQHPFSVTIVFCSPAVETWDVQDSVLWHWLHCLSSLSCDDWRPQSLFFSNMYFNFIHIQKRRRRTKGTKEDEPVKKVKSARDASLSLQRAETSGGVAAISWHSARGRGRARRVILIACRPVSGCGWSRGEILIGGGSVGGGGVLSLLRAAVAVSGGVAPCYRWGGEQRGWGDGGGGEGAVQRGGGRGHEGAGLETPQKLLVVPTQPLLLRVLLLDGLMEVGVLLWQLPTGEAAQRKLTLA